MSRALVCRSISVAYYKASKKNAGIALLFHTVSRAVPSPQVGLTSEFGMGSGVSLDVWSPTNPGAGFRPRLGDDHDDVNVVFSNCYMHACLLACFTSCACFISGADGHAEMLMVDRALCV